MGSIFACSLVILSVTLSWANFSVKKFANEKLMMDKRVFNGTPVKYHQPYRVSIQVLANWSWATDGNKEQYLSKKYINICGGTIIDSHWVLTAAHCLLRKDGIPTHPDSRLVFGTVDLLDWEDTRDTKWYDGHVRTFNDYFTHEGYLAGNGKDDVALIRVPKAIKLDGIYAQAAVIANEDVELGTELNAAGWGMTRNDSEDGPFHLMETNLIVVEDANCKHKGEEAEAYRLRICAMANGTGVCPGDSGSGLIGHRFVYNKTLPVVFGIFSGLLGWCLPGEQIANVFMRVTNYRKWIHYTIAAYVPPTTTTKRTTYAVEEFGLIFAAIFFASACCSCFYLCFYCRRRQVAQMLGQPTVDVDETERLSL